MGTRTRKAEQSEATRNALVIAARELFSEFGYADTFTDHVSERAKVTRGALYHHFRRKEDLFRAVVEDVERDLAIKIAQVAASKSGPWERLLAGSQAYLDASRDPMVQRILLLDAPSVLGWETWRGIDAKYGFGMLKAALQAAMNAGVVERQPVEPLAHLILGALNEAAMMLARAGDAEAARAEVGGAVELLLSRLRVQAAGPRSG